MLIRDLFEMMYKKWLEEMQKDPAANSMKEDLGYSFFLAGAGRMCNGLLALMDKGEMLSAQKVASYVVADCIEEIDKLRKKYDVIGGITGVDIREFKL